MDEIRKKHDWEYPAGTQAWHDSEPRRTAERKAREEQRKKDEAQRRQAEKERLSNMTIHERMREKGDRKSVV